MAIRRALLSLWLIFAILFPSNLIASAAPASPAQISVTAGEKLDAGLSLVRLRHEPRNVPFRVSARSTRGDLAIAQLSTFNVIYLPAGTQIDAGDVIYTCDAWPPQAAAAFTYAANIWGSILVTSVPVSIDACWTSMETGVLGSSGANNYWANFPGAPAANTWYPNALANAKRGLDLDPADSDMTILYNKNYNWYFPTIGTPASGQIDFASVVLHEIAHGLGFSGSMGISGGQGSWGWNTPYPVSYDRFTENESGQSLIDTSVFPNPSADLASQLTSNGIYFDGPNANAANNASRPKLYAPATWEQGSSYSHLDEIFNGTANALMTYSIASQEVVHDPGDVTRGILRDVGWSAAPPPTITSFSPTSGTVEQSVVISGTNFTGATGVKFNGVSAPTFTVNSATQINANVPNGATSGPIGVTTPGGTATSAGSFSVVVPTVSVGDVSVAEGDEGTKSATFNLTLSTPSARLVSVDWRTVDGSATAPSDYQSATGTVQFSPGITSETISIIVNADTLVEPDESFTIELSNPFRATVLDGSGTGQILDDDSRSPTIASFSPTSGTVGTSVTITGTDFTGTTSVTFDDVSASFTENSATEITATVPAGATTGPIEVSTANGTAVSASSFTVVVPEISVSDASVLEGNSGDTSMEFTVSLSQPSAATVGLTYSTLGITAAGAIDYRFPVPNTPLSFAPGETSKKVSIPVIGDTDVEPDETFLLIVANPTNASIADDRGTGTILNDDVPPAPQITGFSPTRGTVGMPITITGTGFTGATSVVFRFWEATSFTVVSDTQITAVVPTGASGSGPITVTTPAGSDDTTDLTPADLEVIDLVVTISDVSQAEGDSGLTDFNFTVSLSEAIAFEQRVDYATQPFNAKTPDDYQTASGTLTFAPGETSKTLTVKVVGDTLYENDDDFIVELSNPTYGRVYGQGWGTIENDDANPLPELSIGDSSVAEGNSDGVMMAFAVTLSAPSAQTVTVSYQTANQSAEAPEDYVSKSDTLTFAPGDTSETLFVIVNGDTTYEGNEVFTVELSGPTNATIADGTGVGTISDDDPVPTPTIAGFSPTSGPVGTSVTITGTNLGGATSVTFDGTSASIGSNTATQIAATVPVGATTGKIAVTTAAGTATSSTDFTVTTDETCSAGMYRAEYFDNATLAGTPVVVVCEAAPLDWDWGIGKPDALPDPDHLSVRWTGQFDFASSGVYRFTATTDDGMRVKVDEDVLLDRWLIQPPTEYVVLKDLAAGLHKVTVEYYENEGHAVAKLGWARDCALGEFKAEYYADGSIGGTADLSACEAAIEHDWGVASPGPGVGADHFAARWLGLFDFPVGGEYAFSVGADDGVRVYLDGTPIVDAWRVQPPTAYWQPVTIPAGKHTIQVDYYEAAGGAVAALRWDLVCPIDQVFCGEYFDNPALIPMPKGLTAEAAIDHDWETGEPYPLFPADRFSARWVGDFSFEAATYEFVARADDGIRLWVDEALLIDQWKDQPPTEYRATKALTAGLHRVRVEYYENWGGAVAQVRWEKASVRREVVVDDTSGGFSKGGSYWREDARGYGGHQWWTYVYGNRVDCWGEWRSNLGGGSYEVFVYVPHYNATTQSARYAIYHQGGTTVKTISQLDYSSEWVSLGTYTFAAVSNGPRVRLTDATGEAVNSRRIAFDAVRFAPR